MLTKNLLRWRHVLPKSNADRLPRSFNGVGQNEIGAKLAKQAAGHPHENRDGRDQDAVLHHRGRVFFTREPNDRQNQGFHGTIEAERSGMSHSQPERFSY